MAGNMAAKSFFTVNALIGEQFLPQKNTDQGIDEMLVHGLAWKDYFMSRGVVDIPPGVTLALVITEYYASRLMIPETQKRVVSVWGKLKLWWKFKRKTKMPGKAEKPADPAQPPASKPVPAQEQKAH